MNVLFFLDAVWLFISLVSISLTARDISLTAREEPSARREEPSTWRSHAASSNSSLALSSARRLACCRDTSRTAAMRRAQKGLSGSNNDLYDFFGIGGVCSPYGEPDHARREGRTPTRGIVVSASTLATAAMRAAVLRSASVGGAGAFFATGDGARYGAGAGAGAGVGAGVSFSAASFA